MKKISALIFSLISVFLIISCNLNFNKIDCGMDESSGTLNIPEGKSLVTVNFSLFNSYAKIAAIPDFSSIDIEKYVVTAKAEGQITQTQDVTAGSTSANIILTNGIEWTIIIEGKSLSDKVLVKGEKKFIPTTESNSTIVSISPYQQTSKDGTAIPGSVKLNIVFPQDESSIKVDWYIDGTIMGTLNADLHSSNVTKVLEASSVEPGTHRITLNMFNSNAPSEVIVKVYDLVVYSNLESKLWDINDTSEDKITMTSDDIMPVTLADCAFYVLGTGVTNLNGTEESVAQLVGKKKAFKFATVQEAVDAIVNADPNGKYKSTVYLDGTFMIDSVTAGTSEIVRIGDGSNKPHIFIKGYNDSASIYNLSYDSARIMTIDSNADVEVKGLTLAFGKISGTSNDAAGGGGAIYCKGKLNFSGNISDCSAGYGGGIYCDGGEIDFTGSILRCKGNKSGAAIYVKAGKITVHDFEITENEANNSAGGVYLNSDNSVKAIFENGKFYNNRAEQGTGGALTCAAQSGSGNGEYIYNACCKNVEFIENKAKGNLSDYGKGGAIYVYDTRFLALIDCTLKDNVGEQVGYGTEKYNGIYNNGVLYLGGTIDVQDGLYLNTPMRLAPTVKPADGKTVIGTIYPSSYTEAKEVMRAYSGSLTSDMISYFSLSNSNWKINSSGKLEKINGGTPGSAGGITPENGGYTILPASIGLDRYVHQWNSSNNNIVISTTENVRNCIADPKLNVEIFNGTGERVKNLKSDISTGTFTVSVNIADLPVGTYSIIVSGISTNSNYVIESVTYDFVVVY